MVGNYIGRNCINLKLKIQLANLRKDSALCYNYSFGPTFNWEAFICIKHIFG